MLSSLILDAIQNRADENKKVIRRYKIPDVTDFLRRTKNFNIAFSPKYLQQEAIFQCMADKTKKLILRQNSVVPDSDATIEPKIEYELQIAADVHSTIRIFPREITACISLLMYLGYHSVAMHERILRRTTKPIHWYYLHDCFIENTLVADPKPSNPPICEISIYVDTTNKDQSFIDLVLIAPESNKVLAIKLLNDFASFMRFQIDEKM